MRKTKRSLFALWNISYKFSCCYIYIYIRLLEDLCFIGFQSHFHWYQTGILEQDVCIINEISLSTAEDQAYTGLDRNGYPLEPWKFNLLYCDRFTCLFLFSTFYFYIIIFKQDYFIINEVTINMHRYYISSSYCTEERKFRL